MIQICTKSYFTCALGIITDFTLHTISNWKPGEVSMGLSKPSIWNPCSQTEEWFMRKMPGKFCTLPTTLKKRRIFISEWQWWVPSMFPTSWSKIKTNLEKEMISAISTWVQQLLWSWKQRLPQNGTKKLEIRLNLGKLCVLFDSMLIYF